MSVFDTVVSYVCESLISSEKQINAKDGHFDPIYGGKLGSEVAMYLTRVKSIGAAGGVKFSIKILIKICSDTIKIAGGERCALLNVILTFLCVVDSENASARATDVELADTEFDRLQWISIIERSVEKIRTGRSPSERAYRDGSFGSYRIRMEDLFLKHISTVISDVNESHSRIGSFSSLEIFTNKMENIAASHEYDPVAQILATTSRSTFEAVRYCRLS